MKLVIAEKPSMARAIKDVVGIGYEVTNAFGHILELAEPDVYLPDDVPVNPKTHRKVWRACDLPIVPSDWKQIPKREAKEQLKKIGELLKKADLVVNAGDPDREGQLLIDEILEHFRYRGRVERVWLSALDKRTYRPLSDAARSRTRADWLVGMNFTRATTLSSGNFYTLGRVQTPTLALVVRRDRSIEAMSSIHKIVSDPDAKKRLKETSGIGTEATRAGILEKLVAQDYIVRKGKQILSTEKGRSLVGFLEATLPDLVDPVTTARWEDALSDVAEGKKPMDAFVNDIAGLARSHTQTLLAKGKGQLVAEKERGSFRKSLSCPVCGGGFPVTRLQSKKKKGVFFWVCPNKNASGTSIHAPLADEAGKPGKPFGPDSARPKHRPGPGPRSRRTAR